MKKIFIILFILLIGINLSSCEEKQDPNINEKKQDPNINEKEQEASCTYRPVLDYYYSLEELNSFYEIYKIRNTGSPLILAPENTTFKFKNYEFDAEIRNKNKNDSEIPFDYIYEKQRTILRSFYSIDFKDEKNEVFTYDIQIFSLFIDSTSELENIEIEIVYEKNVENRYKMFLEEEFIGFIDITFDSSSKTYVQNILSLVLNELVLL